MKTESFKQCPHTWRIFEALVRNFDPKAWYQMGRGAITPTRLSPHVLKSTEHYIVDESTIAFSSGKSFDMDATTAREDELPSQDEMLACIHELASKTEAWLSEVDTDAVSSTFP